MPYLDRYILKQLFFPFIFFLLVFAGILWFNRSLSILDFIAKNRQPAVIFLELCAYLLPQAIDLALPISAFAASAFVTNRLLGESELTVMMASGRSVLRLAVPFAYFGIICFILVSLLGHFALPVSYKKYQDRQIEIAREYVTQIIKVGEFITRDNRSTFYFGAKDSNGDLTDIMIAEQLSPTRTLTYFAQNGKIITQDDTAKLLLFNGTAQELNYETITLDTITFDTLSYDLAQFATNIPARINSVRDFTTYSYLFTPAQTDDITIAAYDRAYFHDRFVKPLLALLIPIIGMATLLVGGFTRGSIILRIIVASVMTLSIDFFRAFCQTQILKDNAHAAVAYIPIVVLLIILGCVLALGSNDIKTLRRARAARQTARAAA